MSNPKQPSRLAQYSDDGIFYPREIVELNGILYMINDDGTKTILNETKNTTIKDANGVTIGTVNPKTGEDVTVPNATSSKRGLSMLSDSAPKAPAATASAGTSENSSRADHVHPVQTSVSGNAGTATKLETARNIGLSGVTATAQSFDGSSNITIPITAVPASIVTGLSDVATSGSYGDLSGTPDLATVATSGKYSDLSGIPGTGTASTLGLTKLYTSTGSSTDGTMTRAAITNALDGKASSSHNHSIFNIKLSGSASGNLDILSLATHKDTRANKLQGMNPDSITIEYSNDSGSTWIDYGIANDRKVKLFDDSGSWAYLGGDGHGGSPQVGDQLRITLDLTTDRRYVSGNSVYLWMYTVDHGIKFDFERKTSTAEEYTYVIQDKSLIGNPDNQIFYFSETLFGPNQNSFLRFTFKCTSIASYTSTIAPRIAKIAMYGSKYYNGPRDHSMASNMIYYDAPYSVDLLNDIVTIPGTLKADALDGNATTATKLAESRTITLTGAVSSDSTSFDGSSDISIPVNTIDGTKITGVIPISSIPKAALERLIPVANNEARLALTPDDAQNGDVIKVTDTGIMYYVVDDSKLGSSTPEDAFCIFTAGAASSVDWSGIENKPNFATVATSGSYNDLINKPTLATVATSGSYADLSGTPSLATVATTGSYTDLLNRPGTATDSTLGLTKLYTSTGSSTDGTMTRAAITNALNGKASYSHNHTTYAIQKSGSGSLNPINSLLMPSKRSNKLFGLYPGCVTVEYSTDGGTTWLDYGATDDEIKLFFCGKSVFYPGGPSNNRAQTTDDMLRITINATESKRYFMFDSLYMITRCSTTNFYFTLEFKGYGSDSYRTIIDNERIAGNPGDHFWYTGGYFGASFNYSEEFMRLTFRCTSNATATYFSGVGNIRMFGDFMYSISTTDNDPLIRYIACNDVPYEADVSTNTVTFPCIVKADSFNGNATTATKLAASKTIGLSGVTATAQSFDGSSNITIPITAVPASIVTGLSTVATSGKYTDLSDKPTLATVATSGSYSDLSNKPTIPSASTTTPSAPATTAVVGTASTYARADHVHPVQTSVSGNAGTATKLAESKTIGLSGVTATAQSFDGSSNITIPITDVPASIVSGLSDVVTKHQDVTIENNTATIDNTLTAGQTFKAIGGITRDSYGHVTKYNVKTITMPSNARQGNGYATCSTAEATTAKVASLTNYSLILDGSVSVRFTNAVPAGSTLNINSTGAKAIYDGSTNAAITAGRIKAGDTATFVYNGTYYYLVSTSSSSKTYTVSVGTSWTGDAAPYTQTLTLNGIEASDNPIVDVVLSSDDYNTATSELEEFAKIYRITTQSGAITVYASDITNSAINIQLKCIK